MNFIKEVEKITGLPFRKAIKQINKEEEFRIKHQSRVKQYSKPEFIDGFGIDHSDVAELPKGY